MKNMALLCLLLLAMPGKKQNPATAGPAPSPGGELEAVLTQMDKASAGFKSAQADFAWDNYQKVVDETDKQTGRVYFHRDGNNVETMFDITSPDAKQVLFKDGKLMLYNPKIDQITEYAPEKSKTDVQAFLNLGFGARGHDLLKTYEVKMGGWETVDAVKTAKLELTALSPKVRSMFSQFVLWIDPQRDVPIKQQVFEPSGDYWLSQYSGFKLGIRIPDDVFNIKKTAKTKVVRPQ
jgi:outer membrane lipoprotein-sorting protein